MSQHDGFDAARTVSPLTTLVRGVIEWGFPARSWTDLHAEFAAGCRTRKLTGRQKVSRLRKTARLDAIV